MAISIIKDKPFEVWNIPLIGVLDHVSDFVPNWGDKSWLIDHLRHLAHKLESENFELVEFGFCVDRSSGCPNLLVKVIPK